MKVEVLFKSHRYEEFDSSTQTCSEPYRGKGLNVLTDWNLYLGSLEENGIILVQHWYDGNPASSQGKVTLEGVEVPASVRKVGCAMLLVSPDELDEIVWLKKDGEKLLWREGEDLINGERFFAQEQLCYSDETTKSINRRAVAVYDYLANAHPTWDEEEVAESMGYTASAIRRIRDAELCQDPEFIEVEDEDDTEKPTWMPRAVSAATTSVRDSNQANHQAIKKGVFHGTNLLQD